MKKIKSDYNFNLQKVLSILKKNEKIIKKAAVVLFIIVAFFVFVFNDKGKEDIDLSNNNGINIGDASYSVNQDSYISSEIYIDVAGAVIKPGVVLIPYGSRVFQAIDAAGGLAKDADTNSINLASELTDGDKIYVPFIDDEKNTFGSSSIQMNNDGKININTADLMTLTKLNGIGVVTAEKIISYREQNGKFKKVEDLKKVNGIGEKTLESIITDICV